MATWKKLISEEMAQYNDNFSNVISSTLTDEDANIDFDDTFGWTEGVPFTLWTIKRVYFPICYDGSEWVGSVSRNPDGIATKHKGGG